MTRVPERITRRAAAIAVAALALAMLFVPLTSAHAQRYKYEIRLDFGGWLPTGSIADDLKSAGALGAAASWTFSPNWAAVASGAWAPSEDKNTTRAMTVNIYQYDLGLEWSTKTSEFHRWDILPFLGGGLGGRSYAPRNENEPDQTAFAGYLTAGLSLASEQATWRIGIRDYVSGWKGIMKTQSTTANDVAILAGIGFRF